MEFIVKGCKHIVQGATTKKVKTASKQQMIKAREDGVHFSLLQLCTNTTGIRQSLAVQVDSINSIQQLLNEFEDLFCTPSKLPPFRPGFDYTIPLN